MIPDCVVCSPSKRAKPVHYAGACRLVECVSLAGLKVIWGLRFFHLRSNNFSFGDNFSFGVQDSFLGTEAWCQTEQVANQGACIKYAMPVAMHVLIPCKAWIGLPDYCGAWFALPDNCSAWFSKA